MFKKIYILTLIYCFVFKESISIKPNDLCIIKECRDQSNQFEYDKCNQLNCHGIYNLIFLIQFIKILVSLKNFLK